MERAARREVDGVVRSARRVMRRVAGGGLKTMRRSPALSQRLMRAQARSVTRTRSTAPVAITRDALTWLLYLLLGYYAFLQGGLGPLMPFLRSELRMSHTLGGLHVSAFSLGSIVVGVVGDRVTRALGRRWALWLGAAGMGAGALTLVLAQFVAFTLLGALLMGLGGGLLLVTIQAALSDHHGERRTIALVEANVIASAAAALAALLIGGLQRSGIGWRGAIILGLALLVVLALRGWRLEIPRQVEQRTQNSDAGRSAQPAKLPLIFWGYWVILFLGVAAEWSVVVWSADFLVAGGGASVTAAASSVAIFFGSEMLGRLISSRLARRLPGERLLIFAAIVALIGVPLFWLAPILALRLLGLALAGLGIGNLYPVTLALATGSAPAHADAASARVALAAGLAVLCAPLALGNIADRAGITHAYGLIGVILALALGAAVGVSVWSARERTITSGAKRS